MKKHITFLLCLISLFVTAELSGQIQINPELTQFEAYKRFGGRPFTLHKDLVTENLSPMSSGLFYSMYDKDYLSSLTDSISSWEGAVCYFPKEIWDNTAAKVQFAKDNKNWIPLTCFLGGEFLGTPHLFKAVEMSELNEIMGVWFLYNLNDPARDGQWWNGVQLDDVTSKSKIYYLKFK